MKKNRFMILLLLLFIIPVVVKADMDAPASSYEVRVSNPDGAYIYEYDDHWKKTDKKIEYDTVLTVMYEMIKDNTLYADAYLEDSEEMVIINLSDCSPIEVDLKDYKSEHKLKYYVFDDTCYLYKGPSTIYGKVSSNTRLEAGTIVESQYYDEMWMYVEVNGVKGWVYRYPHDLGVNEPAGMVGIYDDADYGNIKAMKNLTMYSSPKSDHTIAVSIPKGTKLEIIYSYPMKDGNPSYYVSYNGNYGWVKTIIEENSNDLTTITNIAYEFDGDYSLKVIDKDGINLYSKPNDENSAITIIPYGTIFVPTYYLSGWYSVSDWYQVEYNGNSGWISGWDYSCDDDRDSDSECDVLDYIYSDMEDDEIEDDAEFDDNTDVNNGVNDENNVDDKFDSGTTESIRDNYFNDGSETRSINDIIIFSVCAAIVISLTATVTIILINKKKK